jgi:hypothetical protein
MVAELEQTVIPESLSCLTGLTALDLSSCHQLTDVGLKVIALSFSLAVLFFF